LHTVRLIADAFKLEPEDRAKLLAAAAGQELPDSSSTKESRADRPESAVESMLAEATDDLAHAVGVGLRREEELRRIQDPFPLPVR